MAEEDIKSDINESKEGSEVSGSENEGDESKENISDSENTQQNGDSKKNGDSQKNGDVSEDGISDSEPSPKKKKGVALLDQPVERSGKRERTKTTELYVVEKKEEKELEFNGSGIALAEIPFIQDMIDNKNHGDDLKKLHSICFGRPGKKTTLKKTLRKFNGYTFDKSDAKFTTKQANLEKTNTSELKLVCGILGLERGGTKAEIILRVLEFVIKPYDHKKEVEKKEPGKKKKSKSSKKKEGGKKRKRSDAGKPRGLKKSKGDDKENDSTANDDSTANGDSTADEENDDSTANGDDSTANEDSTAKDSSSSSSDSGTEGSDYEAEKKPKKTPAKKAVKTPAKKVASKTPAKKVASKTPAKKTPAKKTPAKKTPAKKTPAKSVEEVVDSDSSDDSDDEPLVKKKKVAPTNDEIKKKVEKILEGADLEEVTMKKVCQQVYDMYPGFDITDRKSIIKETVREALG